MSELKEKAGMLSKMLEDVRHYAELKKGRLGEFEIEL